MDRIPDYEEQRLEYEKEQERLYAKYAQDKEEEEDDDFIRYAYLFRTLNRRHRLNELEGKK